MSRKFVPLFAASLAAIASASPAAATDIKNESAGPATAVVASAAAAQTKPKGDKALCERLGGVFGIAAVVNRFSDEILTNPALLQNPALVEWNNTQAATRLPGLKVLRTMWIADMAGCGVKFTGLPLEQAHDRFNLTQAEFAAVGGEIVEALQFFNVAQPDIDRLVAIYQSSMDDVVSASQTPREVKPPR
jgi:hemoglobin